MHNDIHLIPEKIILEQLVLKMLHVLRMMK